MLCQIDSGLITDIAVEEDPEELERLKKLSFLYPTPTDNQYSKEYLFDPARTGFTDVETGICVRVGHGFDHHVHLTRRHSLPSQNSSQGTNCCLDSFCILRTNQILYFVRFTKHLCPTTGENKSRPNHWTEISKRQSIHFLASINFYHKSLMVIYPMGNLPQ